MKVLHQVSAHNGVRLMAGPAPALPRRIQSVRHVGSSCRPPRRRTCPEIHAKNGEGGGSERPPKPVKKVQTLSQSLGGADDSYVAWDDAVPLLRHLKIPSVSPEQARAVMEEEGGTLVDIREEQLFDELHAQGSVNVPLFVPCEGSSRYDKARGFFYKLIPALSGMEPTDRNPDFVAEVVGAAGGADGGYILVMCGRGGSIEALPMPGGIESRSWVAIYDLLEGGVEAARVLHVRGGFPAWQAAGLQTEYYE